MSTRFAILSSLALARASGYDLVRRFDRKFNFIWWASHGSVYTELQKLQRDGLVDQVELGARHRVEHSISDRGLEELREWLVAKPSRRPRDEVILRVFSLWLLEPVQAAGYLDSLADDYRSRLEEYRRREANVDLEVATPKQFYDYIALQAGIANETALLDWAKRSADLIRDRQSQLQRSHASVGTSPG